MSLEKILIVDDEESILNQLRWGLAGEYEVITAINADEARRALRDEKPSIVTLDVTLGPPSAGPEGLDLLDEIVEKHPLTKVIMVTGNDSRENAVTAIRRGAVDWYAKPIELEELRVILKRAVHIRQIELAQGGGPVPRRRYHRLVGESEAMRKVFALIQRVASTDVNVLILGENGTGKELVARALHASSPRHAMPFVAVNCSAIPGELFESELFGHEKGAFTGATQARRGHFEEAHGGTLLLDEVADLPTRAQTKLLRVLQEQELTRVGGSRSIRVDVRVIAATNRDLQALVAAGEFREDLYFRLAVIPMRVPALRARAGDIPELVEHFLALHAHDSGRRAQVFSTPALEALARYPFPGNVRELRNIVERLVIMNPGARIGPEHVAAVLPSAGTADPGTSGPALLSEAVRDFERRHIEGALAAEGGNMTRAAARLGLERSHLYKKMNQLGMRAEE